MMNQSPLFRVVVPRDLTNPCGPTREFECHFPRLVLRSYFPGCRSEWDLANSSEESKRIWVTMPSGQRFAAYAHKI